MNIIKVITALCSIMFFMIAADKFFGFMEPPCSLQDDVPVIAWYILGVLQVVAGVLIWLPKYQKHVAGFFAVFMIVFSVVHLTQGTYDIGGALTMAVMLGVLIWNPVFLRGKGSLN